MSSAIIFIHGMFVTGRSWEQWVPHFEQRGYRCVAPDWPLHEGEPAELRANSPTELDELGLDAVIETFAGHASAEDTPPILIGHSLGGLVAQVLVSRGLAAAAVCLNSVAPNAMLGADWDFLKTSAKIGGPAKSEEPLRMSEEMFRASFANAMTEDQGARTYQRQVVPESRRVLHDALGDAGRVDVDQPHPPMLFVGGEHDRVIPDQLNRRNAEAYTHAASVAAFQEFPGRGHLMWCEPGWEQVGTFAADWLQRQVTSAVESTAARAVTFSR